MCTYRWVGVSFIRRIHPTRKHVGFLLIIYNVISVSQFIKTDTNNLGGVIDQNLAYYITYADADGSVGNISLVPDRYHTIQVSTDGTNTVTITPAGAQNETVKLVVTQDMLEKSGGQLQNSPSK
jgi:hypothetical protein